MGIVNNHQYLRMGFRNYEEIQWSLNENLTYIKIKYIQFSASKEHEQL